MTRREDRAELRALLREALRHRGVMVNWRSERASRDLATEGYCRAADRIVDILAKIDRGDEDHGPG